MEAKYNQQNFKSLLQKVRIFNKSIGSYELFAITENFDYAIKLSNGRITFKLEDLQDDEKDALTPERLSQIASTFKSNEASTQLPPSKPASQPIVEKKKGGSKLITVIVVIIALAIIGGTLYNSNLNHSESGESSSATYQERVMSVDEIERSTPVNFLSAEARYNENFWGDKIRLKGTITNTATVVTYKDVVIRVTYYSKTNTVLGNSDHTLYEAFPPTSTTPFDLKVDNYKDVFQLSVEVIGANSY